MRQLIMSRTAETLTLKTGITLEVRSASFRRIRGVRVSKFDQFFVGLPISF